MVSLCSHGDDVVPAAKTLDVGAILFEIGDVPWDLKRLISEVRLLKHNLILVGIKGDQHVQIPQDGIAFIKRTSQVGEIVAALSGRESDQDETGRVNRSTAGTNAFSLTEREYQVLILIAHGFTTLEIGKRLGLSPKTIESRRQTLFSKLGVQNQSHAVAVAAKSGLLGENSKVIAELP